MNERSKGKYKTFKEKKSSKTVAAATASNIGRLSRSKMCTIRNGQGKGHVPRSSLFALFPSPYELAVGPNAANFYMRFVAYLFCFNCWIVFTCFFFASIRPPFFLHHSFLFYWGGPAGEWKPPPQVKSLHKIPLGFLLDCCCWHCHFNQTLLRHN